MNYLVTDVPDGLSQMAVTFLRIHAVRVERVPVERYRARWLDVGIPANVIDQAEEFEARWGGLVLPPAPWYDGGPRALSVDIPEGSPDEGWWFTAGDPRCSVPYGFLIGADGEFGIRADRWTPLHATVEGWVESVALAYHASRWARQITRLSGAAVQDLDLSALEPVRVTAGIADTWWRGPDSLVAVYRGEADCFGDPKFQRADRYDGLPAEHRKLPAEGAAERCHSHDDPSTKAARRPSAWSSPPRCCPCGASRRARISSPQTSREPTTELSWCATGSSAMCYERPVLPAAVSRPGPGGGPPAQRRSVRPSAGRTGPGPRRPSARRQARRRATDAGMDGR